MLISYAQNFEDVMLWRAVGRVENGFYIDIGAQDPVIDSVSKAFYEHGWRGIHVEPTAHYAGLLRQDRPDELVIQSAVSDQHGTIRFYDVTDEGLSTGDEAIARGHEQQGFSVHETIVPCITLDDLFEQVSASEIHWLKIDVEGMEHQVLAGWMNSQVRPWIVIVESTIPCSSEENWMQWEPLLLVKGYKCAYFDGLNRFYVSINHPELEPAFRLPPNVFDGFALAGSASASFCQLFKTRYDKQEGESQLQVKQVQDELEERLDTLRREIQCIKHESAEQERSLRSLLAQVNEESRRQAHLHLNEIVEHERAASKALEVLRNEIQQQEREWVGRERVLHADLARREQEFGEKLLITQQSAENDKAELLHLHSEQEKSLQQQFTDILVHYQQLHEEFRQHAAAIDEHLKQQLQEEKQAVIQYKQVLATLQQQMNRMHSSFSWWITAPLRKVSGIFCSSEPSIYSGSSKTFESTCEQISVRTRSQSIKAADCQIPLERRNMPTSTPPENTFVAQSLDELLSFFDEHFVCCAYRTLLGREPDVQGMEYYLDRLRKGYSKESVVVQLAKSKEAQQIGLKLTGLDSLMRKQKSLYMLLALLFPGWFVRHRTQQQLNKMENTLARMEGRLVHLETDIVQRIGRVEQALASMHSMSCQSEHMPAATVASPSPSEEPQPDLSRLTTHAQVIYKQLRNTCSLSAVEGRNV